MAEELQFGSRTENKRKYEEEQTAGPRRPTGFSAPITSSSPDAAAPPPPLSSYNSVAPPDEIQLAKQRAQEIAARLFNNAEAKRPRLDDESDRGFSSGPNNDLGQKMGGGQYMSQVGMVPSSIPVSYGGFQGSSKKIDIPNGRVGVIIGKGGETIKYLQLQSGAKIQVTRDMDVDPNSQTRLVELMGTQEQISKAEQLITEVLAEAEAGGSGVVSRRYVGQAGGEQFSMKVPNNKVGLIIGKGGETIKNMQARSGARIQLIPLHLPPGDTSTERTVYIDGTTQQIETAKQLVNEVISENRPRNPGMGGGYNQQGYRPPQPQNNWGPPGPPPVQQPGYGYMQPGGAYSGAPPQYNMSQPPYSGYPPQSNSGWDQSSAPPTQQSTQSSGYDYYNQQPPQQQQTPGGSTTPTDNSGYNYGQPPASSYNQPQGSYGGSGYSQPPAGQQGYSQDGYGGYHAAAPQTGYGQAQTNANQGYDQSQGYSAAPAYGSGVNSTPDGAAASYGSQGGPTQVPPVQPPVTTQQGYGTQSNTAPSYPPQGPQPTYPQTSQPAYGTQPVTQTSYGQSAPLTPTSYGAPQGQKPPPGQAVYGQTPSSQAGYVQPAPAQPVYSHAQTTPTQTSSGQPDSSHRVPSSTGYGSAAPQSGYVQPTYGVPPATQPAYGAQQQAYGDSYAGGYSQPPVYSSDGTTAGGNAQGTYDAAAGAQPVQPSAVPKASPQT